MAIESVATQTPASRDQDPTIRAEALYHLGLGASSELWQIAAIAQMLNDHEDVQKADFPDEVAGGIAAILNLASRGRDHLLTKL